MLNKEAVFSEETDQRFQWRVSGGINHIPATAPTGHQTCLAKVLEVKGERGRRDRETLGNTSGRHSAGSDRRDQSPKLQSLFLPESLKQDDSLLLI